MEKSLKYAIEKAKKNIWENKYSKIENILDAVYQYYIREDEIETMMKIINRYIEKHSDDYFVNMTGIYNADDIEYIKQKI